jgi:hypothetical protein
MKSAIPQKQAHVLLKPIKRPLRQNTMSRVCAPLEPEKSMLAMRGRWSGLDTVIRRDGDRV